MKVPVGIIAMLCVGSAALLSGCHQLTAEESGKIMADQRANAALREYRELQAKAASQRYVAGPGEVQVVDLPPDQYPTVRYRIYKRRNEFGNMEEFWFSHWFSWRLAGSSATEVEKLPTELPPGTFAAGAIKIEFTPQGKPAVMFESTKDIVISDSAPNVLSFKDFAQTKP